MEKIIAVASMQRNEEKYILEWFAYYLVQGVNKFVIYNHMSTDGTQSVYEKLKQVGYNIDIHYRDGYNVHYPMLHHAINEVLPTVDWLIFADMDEFYLPSTPVQNSTIKDILDRYEDKNISALGIYWCAFGSSGHVADPELVTRDYTHRGHFNISTNHHMKSIVKGKGRAGAVYGTNPHVFTTEFGTFSTLLEEIPPYAGHNINGNITHDILRINHYQCKSWEYFKNVKQARGSTADRHPDAPGAQIPDSVFHDYDYNDEVDTQIWDNWGDKILQQMNILKEQIA